MTLTCAPRGRINHSPRSLLHILSTDLACVIYRDYGINHSLFANRVYLKKKFQSLVEL
jgi:alpha-galactosidase/6-phospho-beta-glucosidase family protein